MKIIFCFVKYLALVFLLFGLTSAFSSKKKNTPISKKIEFKKADDTGVTEEGKKEIISGNNQFAFKLYSDLNSESSNKNIFFSPYGIFTAMAMTYEGANGQTAKEMQSMFHFPTDDKVRRPAIANIYNLYNTPTEEYQLLTANALWIQENLKSKMFKEIQKYYGAEIFTKTSAEKVNQWIENKTMNKFNNVVQDCEPPRRGPCGLSLINTIYFKGDWKQKFEKTNTRESPFIINEKEEVKIPMMNITKTFNYMETETMQMLEMLYKGEKLSMLILLPKSFPGKPTESENPNALKNTEADLISLEKALEKNIKKWRETLRSQRVRVYVPKFTFEKDYELVKTLKPYMPSMFNSQKADFRKFAENLYISSIIHKSFVDVNEEGTEAAAVTVAVATITSSPPPPPVFNANHPFIFLIQERETGQILFIGKVVNPIEGSDD